MPSIMMKRKIKKILESTITKTIGIVLATVFCVSLVFCFDFYVNQLNKIKGYYWIYKGDKAFKKHDLQSAVNCYEYGIKLHPRHWRAMYNLANIYVVYEDYYSALDNYEKALLIRPKFEIARINYAIILSETYKTDKAIEQYKKVVSTRPKFIKIPFIVDSKKSYNHNRGVAYYNMGLAYRTKSLFAGVSKDTSRFYLQQALDSYEKAAEILKSYSANYNLALTHHLLNNNNQAGYYYCKAIQKAPMEYEAHFNLAILLKDMKDYKNAQEEFKRAGLLLDNIGDQEKMRYLYDTLSDVNQKIAIFAPDGYFKKLNEEYDRNNKAKYKAGKLVLDGKDDEELIKNFKICAGHDIFMSEGEN